VWLPCELLYTCYLLTYLPLHVLPSSSSPARPRGVRPPNTFLCNSQPKICSSVKTSPTVTGIFYFIFFAWNSEVTALGGAVDSAHPTASRGTAAHQVVESGEAEEVNFELRFVRLLLARLACVVVVLRRTERSPWRNIQIRYDTIRDAVSTCAPKLARVSLIYRTETTTKKRKR